MKFAYADPPYLGCGRLYAKHHPEAMIWDDPETHRALIQRLCDEYPDGWAMSGHQKSLRTLLPMCPDDCRVGAWVKQFGVINSQLSVQNMWEPVIWRGGRRLQKERGTSEFIRDWVAHPMSAWRSNDPRNGVPGEKPRAFSRWVFSLLSANSEDSLDDLFPGSGAVSAHWAEYIGEKCPLPALPLESFA